MNKYCRKTASAFFLAPLSIMRHYPYRSDVLMRLSVFIMAAWGLYVLASRLFFEVCAIPLSEQKLSYSQEAMWCLQTRPITKQLVQ